MIKFTAVVRGLEHLERDLKAEKARQVRAMDTAIKVEAFTQLRKLRQEIREGRPGGIPYRRQLSAIASRTKTGRKKKNQAPLSRLARLIRYQISGAPGSLNVSFGYTKMSTSWKRLILKHTDGIDPLYTGSRTIFGRRMARIGGKLKKKGDPDAKYFFIRSTTGRRIEIPPRPMIEPFWRRYETNARINIHRNWLKKVRGERI